MKSEEVMKIWAMRQLDQEFVEYSPEDYIYVREEEFVEGYCETCYSEETRLVIFVNNEMVLKTWNESMSEILDELLEIASGVDSEDSTE